MRSKTDQELLTIQLSKIHKKSHLSLFDIRTIFKLEYKLSLEKRKKSNWKWLQQNCERLLSFQKIFQFVNALIFINLVVLSFNQYPSVGAVATNILSSISLACVTLFSLYDVVKIIAWRRIDVNNVYLFVEIVFEFTVLGYAIKCYGEFVSFSALKGFRLLWMFQDNLQINWNSYKIMLDALKKSIQTLINVALILGVFIYMGSVIGMWLFSGKMKFNEKGDIHEKGYSPRSNFDTILFSYTTVFHLISGDQWNRVWYNCVRTIGEGISHPYFIIILVIGKIIFMNSFIAIMLGNFEEARNLADVSRAKGNKKKKYSRYKYILLSTHILFYHSLYQLKQSSKLLEGRKIISINRL